MYFINVALQCNFIVLFYRRIRTGMVLFCHTIGTYDIGIAKKQKKEVAF